MCRHASAPDAGKQERQSGRPADAGCSNITFRFEWRFLGRYRSVSVRQENGMGSPGEPSAAERHRIAESWLSAFSELLKAREYDRVARMMHADCYWRDLLTFSWDFKTLHGVDEVKSWLVGTFDCGRGAWVSSGGRAHHRRHRRAPQDAGVFFQVRNEDRAWPRLCQARWRHHFGRHSGGFHGLDGDDGIERVSRGLGTESPA